MHLEHICLNQDKILVKHLYSDTIIIYIIAYISFKNKAGNDMHVHTCGVHVCYEHSFIHNAEKKLF